jgi:hypothetical protein
MAVSGDEKLNRRLQRGKAATTKGHRIGVSAYRGVGVWA